MAVSNTNTVGDPMSSVFNDKTKTGLAQEISDAGDKRWAEYAEGVITDLTTSGKDIMTLMMDSMEGGELSPAKQMFLQEAMNLRKQMTETLSNVLRLLSEAAQTVIRNIR